MSQEKAQLIAPIGITTFTGLTATGVITATSFTGNITGSAKSLVDGTNVTAGVMTATSFAGNLTGNIQRLADGTPNINVGVTTATSFVGNLTGSVTDLTSAPNITVGVVTATRFEGPVTGDVRGNVTGNVTGVATGTQSGGNVVGNVVGDVTGDVDGDITGNITGNIQGAVTGNITGNIQGNVTGNVVGDVTGDVTGNITGDIQGNVTGNVTGNATGVAAGGLGINYNGGWTGAGTSQVRVGVVTATTLYGDGSNLDGVSSGPVSQQAVTANSGTTAIDLSNGNVIYMTQSANTTISFSNPENGNVYIVRTKDDNDTARTITWPDTINWDGGTAPTLIQDNPRSTDAQVFLLVTRNMGVTWYGKEVVNVDPQTFSLWSWGRNFQGSTGQNYTEEPRVSSPIQIGANTNWKHMMVSSSINNAGFTATKTDGTLWSWGYNGTGALGKNDRTSRSSPTQIPGTTWDSPWGSGDGASFCVKTDGTLWSWGYNKSGALGLNQAHEAKISSPTQLPGTTWSTGREKNSGAGLFSSYAVKTNGTLWVWGYNNDGQLGVNNRTYRSSPTQVGTDTTWDKVDVGNETAFGIKTDGTIWSWGSNTLGSLGLNQSGNNRSSPTQIGTNTTWNSVDSGYRNTGAIKTNGTLWMWGGGETGELGQNNRTSYSSPKQVGTDTTWSQVQCGKEYTLAVKTDGTLWSWGNQISGNLGLNNQIKYSSPVQIPGTSWGLISAAYAGTFGFQKAG